MIGLIALAIAFFTLLSPSTAPSEAAVELDDGTAGTAMPAVPRHTAGGGVEELLGRWEVSVQFPGESEQVDLSQKSTELVIVDLGPEEVDGPSVLGLEFGPEGERWRGELSLQVSDDGCQFACRASCDEYAGQVAFISGRRDGGCLRGVVYFGDDGHLLTWEGLRPGH